MGMYDDGGVEFAQQAFKDASDRGIEQAKKARKEGRRQRLVDTFLTEPLLAGINSSITTAFDDRAKNLQDKNIPMRTYLQSYLSNQESQRTNLEYSKDTNPNGFIVNGLVDINRLQNYIAGDMMQQLDSSQRFANVNKTQLRALILDQSRQEADRLKDYYQNLYNESMDVPDMQTILSQFDKWNSRENPKNVFGAITKGVKRFIGMETPETLDYKNLEAHENLRISLGENLSREMIELKNAVTKFDEQATISGSRFDIDGLIANVKTKIENGEITGQILADSMEVTKTTIERKGVEYEVNTMRGTMLDPNTGLPRLFVAGQQEIKKGVVDAEPLKPEEKNSGVSALERILSNPNAVEEYADAFTQIIRAGADERDEFGNLETEYGNLVAHTIRNIDRNYKDVLVMPDGQPIDRSRLEFMAANYVLNQVYSGYKYSQMSEEELKAQTPPVTKDLYEELLTNPDTSPSLFNLFKAADFRLEPGFDNEDAILNGGNLQAILNDARDRNAMSDVPTIAEYVRDVVLSRTRDENGNARMGLESFMEDNGISTEGTYEQQVRELEIYFLEGYQRIISDYDPDKKINIVPDSLMRDDGTSVPTPDPTPDPEPDPEPVDRELTFIARNRVNQIQRAIDAKESGKMSSFNSGAFRRFVGDKTDGGTLFGKDRISPERELSLLKEYLQFVLDDPDNYKDEPKPAGGKFNRNKPNRT